MLIVYVGCHSLRPREGRRVASHVCTRSYVLDSIPRVRHPQVAHDIGRLSWKVRYVCIYICYCVCVASTYMYVCMCDLSSLCTSHHNMWNSGCLLLTRLFALCCAALPHSIPLLNYHTRDMTCMFTSAHDHHKHSTVPRIDNNICRRYTTLQAPTFP